MVHLADFEDRTSPLSRRLVPDELWDLAKSLIPLPKTRPQGGGRARIGDRAVFVAVVYVLTSGCAWRRLPESFGIAVPTAYRRFVEWNAINLWDQLHQAALARGQDDSLVEWTRAISEAATARAASGT